ncbi:MAG: thiamine pyrophosphate-dependent enzyme, partial [Nocardioidaceae bacterium]
LYAAGATAGAPHHDWLCLTGGAIGQGLPVALGAAVASPDRQVISLQSDGSAQYTVQALWTMAREQTRVVVVIVANHTYEILRTELRRMGVDEPRGSSEALTSLGSPPIDWPALARGYGVDATRAHTGAELSAALSSATRVDGPFLIEANVEETRGRTR